MTWLVQPSLVNDPFSDPDRGGVEVEIVGRLNTLLGETAYPQWDQESIWKGDEPPTRGFMIPEADNGALV